MTTQMIRCECGHLNVVTKSSNPSTCVACLKLLPVATSVARNRLILVTLVALTLGGGVLWTRLGNSPATKVADRQQDTNSAASGLVTQSGFTPSGRVQPCSTTYSQFGTQSSFGPCVEPGEHVNIIRFTPSPVTGTVDRQQSRSNVDLEAIKKGYQEYYAAGQYAEALVEAQKLEAAIKTQFGTDHASYAGALNGLARIYLAQRKYVAAELTYKRALTIQEKGPAVNQLDVARTFNNLSNVKRIQGGNTVAGGLHTRSSMIYEKGRGLDHPDVGDTLNDLALVYCYQDRYEEAERLYSRALAIYEKARGSNHSSVARTFINLAIVRGRVMAINERDKGANHIDVTAILEKLVDVSGVYRDGLATYERALAILDKLASDHHGEASYAEAEEMYKYALGSVKRFSASVPS
jgi:tetratricopeptide (TPR) repeat protein